MVSVKLSDLLKPAISDKATTISSLVDTRSSMVLRADKGITFTLLNKSFAI